MFGKKKDDDAAADQARETAEVQPRNYQRSEPAQPASRPALNPEIARRGPDLSVFGPRRDAGSQPAAAAAAPKPSSEPDTKKLIVGGGIALNGEIRTCDTLVVEGRVEAVLQECKNIEIMGPGEFKGAAEVDVADISGRFDGDLTARQRLIVRAGGKVLGKIRYGQLEIERGGVLSGEVEVLPEAQIIQAPTAAVGR
ncbi:MAG TPA: polymer-forming cytoskeletal protein [Dongiaceae bacterium]|jgi:cytoskeletal protein CcmA (bactofilin family)|nr:polymer-forming cytoskeletal protein [Dongiaceae bacterium]